MDSPLYVKIKSEENEDDIELPTEGDGTILLSSVASQFPGAVGLRYKSETGSWRGVSLNDTNTFVAPPDGWGSVVYHVVLEKRAPKRKAESDSEDDDDDSPLGKLSKMSEREILSDLVVRNLPYSSTSDDLKAYFSKYGELDTAEAKIGADGKGRGFGFISFKSVEAVKACLSEEHTLQGRKIEVTYPKRRSDKSDDIPSLKLFVGRLPNDTTKEDLKEFFSEFGELTDAYVPQPFKGYGFVTFTKKSSVKKVLKKDHRMKGRILNVGFPQTEKFVPGAAPPIPPNKSAGGAGYNSGGGYNSSSGGYYTNNYNANSGGYDNYGSGRGQYPGSSDKGSKLDGSQYGNGYQNPSNADMANVFSMMFDAFKNQMPNQRVGGGGSFGSRGRGR